MNNYISNYVNQIKKIPLTFISIIIFSILLIIDVFVSNNGIIKNFKSLITLLLMLFFLVENAFKGKKRVIPYFLSIIVALIVNYLPIFMIKILSSDFLKYLEYIKIACLISILLLTLFLIIKNKGLELYEYVYIVLNNIFKVFVIYFISTIGITFLITLYEVLIFSNVLKLSEVSFILISSLYLLPGILLSFIDIEEKKINNLFEGICLYCIYPINILSIAIIYFYILKLLFTKNIPNNFIFMFALIVFLVGLMLYFVFQNHDYKLTNIFYKFFSYIYIPPILIQIYSVFIRINNYGFTPSRYIICVIAILETLVLALTIYKKGKYLNYLLLIAILLCIISTLTPLNLVRVSNISQQKILLKNYKDNKSKAYNSYSYLKKSIYGKKYINKNIENNFKNYKNNNYCSNNKYYVLSNNEGTYNIEDYKQMKSVNFMFYVKKNELGKIDLVNKNKEVVFSINIDNYSNDLIKKIEKNENEKNEIFKNNSEIIIDNDNKLVLYYFYIKYDKTNKKIVYESAKGYLFSK